MKCHERLSLAFPSGICTVAENCNERPNDGFPFLGNEGEKLERP